MHCFVFFLSSPKFTPHDPDSLLVSPASNRGGGGEAKESYTDLGSSSILLSIQNRNYIVLGRDILSFIEIVLLVNQYYIYEKDVAK